MGFLSSSVFLIVCGHWRVENAFGRGVSTGAPEQLPLGSFHSFYLKSPFLSAVILGFVSCHELLCFAVLSARGLCFTAGF